jgi:hypothetical protein
MSDSRASPTFTTSDPPSETSTVPRANRSAGRNVHIYDANDSTAVLGGLILANGVTNANFYSMVEILFIFTGIFFLQDENGIRLERDGHPLQPGKYYIISSGEFLYNHPFMIK